MISSASTDSPRTVSSLDPGSATRREPLQPSSKRLSTVSFCPVAMRIARARRATSADWRWLGAMARLVLPGRKIIECDAATAAAVDLPDWR